MLVAGGGLTHAMLSLSRDRRRACFTSISRGTPPRSRHRAPQPLHHKLSDNIVLEVVAYQRYPMMATTPCVAHTLSFHAKSILRGWAMVLTKCSDESLSESPRRPLAAALLQDRALCSIVSILVKYSNPVILYSLICHGKSHLVNALDRVDHSLPKEGFLA